MVEQNAASSDHQDEAFTKQQTANTNLHLRYRNVEISHQAVQMEIAKLDIEIQGLKKILEIPRPIWDRSVAL